MKAEAFGCKNTNDKIGVLIAQLGTPDAPSTQALRPYLKKFLGDPRVIEKPRWLWWLIMNFIILPLRPARSAKLYKRIWTDQGSPLLIYTQKQTAGVRERLNAILPSIEVEYGMRYSDPSLEAAIDSLIEKGCSKILLFNMYAHYSATTVASNYDAVFRHLLKRRNVPTLNVMEPYYVHPEYINSLAVTINKSLAEMTPAPQRLVFSYHGIPESYIEKGDIYCCHCAETSRALIPLLNIDADKVIHTYQSRFGRDPWLVPYTDETIKELADSGVKNIAVACPGFTADCLETLDELGHEARADFSEHGGASLQLIPCLNDSPEWLDAMALMIRKEIHTWLETAHRSQQVDCKIACPVKIEKARVSA